jgi:DNA-binding XRE family transcriptional regulator
MALTIKQKKDWAKLLYLKTQMNQKEIANRVQITEKTMGKWVKAEKWDLLRSSFTITKEQELRRIYQQIHELNNAIEQREEGKRFATGKEADTLSKMAGAARALETDTSIAQIIDTSIEIIRWIQESDFEKAKELSDYFDSFIKYKLNKA